MALKRNYLLLFFLLFLAFPLFGQQMKGSAAEVELSAFYKEDVRVRKTGMLILGSWAVGNIGLGLVQRSRLEKSTAYYFHEMNALWNVVNLGIAGAGYYFSSTEGAPTDIFSLNEEAVKFQKILLFNAGLDLAYMAGGFYLLERSKNSESRAEQFRGYGRSLILQGAFLFTFDLIMHAVHSKISPDLAKVLSSISISPMHASIQLSF